MPAFFIVTIEIPDKNDRGSYDAYIEQVKADCRRLWRQGEGVGAGVYREGLAGRR